MTEYCYSAKGIDSLEPGGRFVITPNEFKKGTVIRLEGELYSVLERQHVKPGKGGAFVRTKLRFMKKGSVIEKTFRPDEKIEEAFIERRKVQYLYENGDQIVIMDSENYEQYNVSKEVTEKVIYFLKEGVELEMELFEGNIINLIPSIFVEMQVTNTDPGLKGDTVSGATKPATVETGYTLQVPLFVNNNDILKIDTRTGEYVERV